MCEGAGSTGAEGEGGALELLDLGGGDDGVGLANLLLPEGLIVEGAVVGVAVAVQAAVEPAAPALEACKGAG